MPYDKWMVTTDEDVFTSWPYGRHESRELIASQAIEIQNLKHELYLANKRIERDCRSVNRIYITPARCACIAGICSAITMLVTVVTMLGV